MSPRKVGKHLHVVPTTPSAPVVARELSRGEATLLMLNELAADHLDEARKALELATKALESDDPDEELSDGHILDAKWALGERRGVMNAIADLSEAGLLK